MYETYANIQIKHLQLATWKHLLQHMTQTIETFGTYVYSPCNMCNIAIYFCNTDIKYLQHTIEISETLETYVYNMRFQRNISLLHRNGGSLTRGVHRCRARRTGGECRGRSGGEGRGGLHRWRRQTACWRRHGVWPGMARDEGPRGMGSMGAREGWSERTARWFLWSGKRLSDERTSYSKHLRLIICESPYMWTFCEPASQIMSIATTSTEAVLLRNCCGGVRLQQKAAAAAWCYSNLWEKKNQYLMLQ